MLVLSRKRDEQIVIGDDIVITVVQITSSDVRLGFEAPLDVAIHRQEVYKQIRRERRSEADYIEVDGRLNLP